MRIKKYLPIIGLAIFVYILIKIGIANVFLEIKNANFLLLALAGLFLPILFLTQTLKWFYIARKQKIDISFKEAFKINLITLFYGFVTPSKLGTIIRANYLKKYTSNIGKGLRNFALDKIFDMSSVFFIAIAFSFIFNLNGFPRFYMMLILAAFIIGTLIISSKTKTKFLLRVFYKRILPEKLKERAKIAFESFYEDMPEKKYFVLFFLLNIINWMIIYFIAFIIGRAVGIELNLLYFLAIMPIGTMVSLIPITIDGLGTREAALISLFGLFNAPAGKVFSMSVLNLLITNVIPSIVGSFFSIKNREI